MILNHIRAIGPSSAHRLLGLFFFVLCFSSSPAHAQVSASMKGVISDPTGADISAATVTARNTETGAVRTTASDETGNYLILALPVGQYEVKASKSGFQDIHRTGINLVVGEEATVAYGDKCVGTNHILPTGRAARYTGGLWVGKFLRTVTYQEVNDTESSALLGEVCGRASRVERFEGHARSGDVRVAKYRGSRLPWFDDTPAT